jgi:general transcription factor 3C polypeptide 5 (transcription factor C subunit 1)
MSRTIESSGPAAANNILLKITIPKRTGRKRKRGSQDPYEYDASAASGSATAVPKLDSKQILRCLRDNVDKYQVEAVGKIERHHVFRGQCRSTTFPIIHSALKH